MLVSLMDTESTPKTYINRFSMNQAEKCSYVTLHMQKELNQSGSCDMVIRDTTASSSPAYSQYNNLLDIVLCNISTP